MTDELFRRLRDQQAQIDALKAQVAALSSADRLKRLEDRVFGGHLELKS